MDGEEWVFGIILKVGEFDFDVVGVFDDVNVIGIFGWVINLGGSVFFWFGDVVCEVCYGFDLGENWLRGREIVEIFS